MKLDVRLLVPGLAFDPNDPYGHSLGGSETSGIQLAAAIAALGHTVTVFATVEQPATWNKVNFLPAQGWDQTMAAVPCDVAIVQRAPMAFARRMESKVNFLWVHDLLFARRSQELQGSMHAIDRIVTVSRFQRDQYREVASQIPEATYLVSRNGIDLDLIVAARETAPAREPGLIVCGSRPERGVDVLLTQVFPRILKQVPGARLALAQYDCPNPAIQPLYDDLQRIAGQFGDKVEWHGALNKADLYQLYQRASIYLYPTPSPGDPSFRETSCISAMESMALGCPVVATKRGGLIETVGDAGVLIDLEGAEHAAGEAQATAFVDAAVRLLQDGKAWSDLQARGREHAADLGWGPVATQIIDEAKSILREQSSDPVRLARHFIRRQDIEAAKATFNAVRDTAIFAPQPADKLAELTEVETALTARYAYAATPETLAAYYAERVGPGNEQIFQILMASDAERFNQNIYVRFDQVDSAIRRQLHLPLEPKVLQGDQRGHLSILDFGCSQGECPISLHNRLGARVLGVDASPSEIERAGKLAAAKATRPGALVFDVANERDFHAVDDYLAAFGVFDALVMGEVVEHLIDPVAVIERLEAAVRPGGAIVITVPYGPWETQQPEPLRGQHLREWSANDLIDVFAGKPSFVRDMVPLMVCPISGDVLGTIVFSYQADQKPLRAIDWSRKLTSQRPRQSLSACMIVGGQHSHETLHWCLRPVAEVADEIVIADTGMSEEARRIALQYRATIVEKAPSPLEVGFDVARNLALDQCRSDWVMMIDGDERLLSPLTLWRYLRENMYHSYAIPQHHFAVDAAWKPDLPGRLFRRRPDPEGRVIRHVGRLHEHPEFGVNQGAGMAMLLGDVRLGHVGYLDQQIRAGRFIRNLPMLRMDLEAHPDRMLTNLVMCRDSMIQCRYLMALQGLPYDPGAANRLPEAARLCRDVITIWERMFADDAGPMAHEAMEFYHDACKLLGTDVLADGFAVQRQGVGSGVGPNAVHFYSVEHYERWAASRLKAATQPLLAAGY